MLIFNYVFKQFLKFTFGILLLAIFMFVLSDVIDKYGRLFEKYQASGTDVFLYYLYEIPFQVIQIAPFAALIGAISTMVVLNRNGEIIAIRAAGMGPFKLARGIIAGGVLCAVISFVGGEYVVPNAIIKRNQLVDKLKGDKSGSVSDNKWVKSGSWVYTYKKYDLTSKTLYGLQGFRRSDDKNALKQMWTSSKAVYDEDSSRWQVFGRKKVKFSGGNVKYLANLPDRLLSLPYKPERLFRDERMPLELSFSELTSKIREMKNTSSQYRRYEVSFHVKLGYCLAGLLLALLGVKFGFTFERSSQTMKSLLTTIVIGIGYWLVLSSSRALILSSTLPVWIAGWSANIFLAGVIFFEARKLTKF